MAKEIYAACHGCCEEVNVSRARRVRFGLKYVFFCSQICFERWQEYSWEGGGG